MLRTVPNQKIVRVNKQPVKGQLFAQINLEAMELAARGLDAGAFKLWCYFAKNQNAYQFALSSADAEATMGIKIKQYNNAVKELIEKKYLIQSRDGSNIYDFFEVSQAVHTKEDNGVITKGDNSLSPCSTRNNIDTTFNSTSEENNSDIWARNDW